MTSLDTEILEEQEFLLSRIASTKNLMSSSFWVEADNSESIAARSFGGPARIPARIKKEIELMKIRADALTKEADPLWAAAQAIHDVLKKKDEDTLASFAAEIPFIARVSEVSPDQILDALNLSDDLRKQIKSMMNTGEGQT